MFLTNFVTFCSYELSYEKFGEYGPRKWSIGPGTVRLLSLSNILHVRSSARPQRPLSNAGEGLGRLGMGEALAFVHCLFAVSE